jgi:chitin synthase
MGDSSRETESSYSPLIVLNSIGQIANRLPPPMTTTGGHRLVLIMSIVRSTLHLLLALIVPRGDELAHAETVGNAELEAMLETGFDSRDRDRMSTSSPRASTYIARYQLTDGSSPQLANVHGNGYSPLTRSTSPGGANPSHIILCCPLPHPRVNLDIHALPPTKQLTTKATPPAYGPLGPLDPSSRF